MVPTNFCNSYDNLAILLFQFFAFTDILLIKKEYEEVYSAQSSSFFYQEIGNMKREYHFSQQKM